MTRGAPGMDYDNDLSAPKRKVGGSNPPGNGLKKVPESLFMRILALFYCNTFKVGCQFFRGDCKSMMEPALHGFDVSTAVIIHIVVFGDLHIRSTAANTITADQDFKLGLEVSPEKIRAFTGEDPHISFTIIPQMIEDMCQHNIQGTGFPREVVADVLAMVLLDMLAPIFLLIGLSMSTPESVSLLNNFEIVATTAIAMPFSQTGRQKTGDIHLPDHPVLCTAFTGISCFPAVFSRIAVCPSCLHMLGV